MALNKAKIFTISSMKGGVGKSVFTTQLAVSFAKLKKQVLIIDLDLHSGVIAAMLNVPNDNDICKLIDDLNNNRFRNLDDYIYNYDTNIDVLPAPKDPRAANKVSMKYLNVVLGKATMKYDIILIDSNHIIDEINLMAFDNSDELIYLLSDDAMDFKNMRTMISILRDTDHTNYTVILNNAFRRKNLYFSQSDAKNLIKSNIDYVLPSDFYVRTIDKYIMDGRVPLINKKMINKFNMICNNLLKEKKKG